MFLQKILMQISSKMATPAQQPHPSPSSYHIVAGLLVRSSEVIRVNCVAPLHVHLEHVVDVPQGHDANG